MAVILSFRICAKNEKHKFASISLTVRDRAISSKFSTHRVSRQTTLCNFQKIFIPLKMAAILNIRIFTKNAKTQICFYLLNRARKSNFVEIFHPQGISAIYYCQFCPSFRAKPMLPFGWTLRMPMRPISSLISNLLHYLPRVVYICTRRDYARRIQQRCFIYRSIFAIPALHKRRVQGHCAAYHFRISFLGLKRIRGFVSILLFILNQLNALCTPDHSGQA